MVSYRGCSKLKVIINYEQFMTQQQLLEIRREIPSTMISLHDFRLLKMFMNEDDAGYCK